VLRVVVDKRQREEAKRKSYERVERRAARLKKRGKGVEGKK
jgi:hypothetical protein